MAAEDVQYKRIWFDYDFPFPLGYRITVTEWWAFFWISMLTIWITIWLPRFWKHVVNVLTTCLRRLKSWKVQNTSVIEDDDFDERVQEDIFLGPTGIRQDIARERTVSGIITTSHTPESGAIQLLRLIFQVITERPIALPEVARPNTRTWIERVSESCSRYWQNISGNWAHLTLLVLAVGFCAVVFAAAATAATAVVYLGWDNKVLPTYHNCGFWVTPNMYEEGLSQGKTDDRATSYHTSCYGNTLSSDCQLFVHDRLPYSMIENDVCPFLGDVCLLGNHTAVTFDTGFIQAKLLGINSKRQLFFRRKSTCSPVVTNGYVKTVEEDGVSVTRFFYGSTILGNYTWNERKVPRYDHGGPIGYKVGTAKERGSLFRPDRGFSSDKGYVSLLFISAFGVWYPQVSADPIFPAKLPFEFKAINTTIPVWLSDAWHSNVLGCVELCEIFTSLNQCLNAYDLVTGLKLKTSEWLVLLESLLLSSIASSLGHRGGQNLDATKRILNEPISFQLEEEQWKLEVRRLYEISLIRIQMKILEIVQGTAADIPEAKNFLPPKYRDICGMIKLPAKGYRNLSLVGILIAISLPPFIGLSIKQHPPVWWTILGFWRLGGRIFFWSLKQLNSATRLVSNAVYYYYCIPYFRRRQREVGWADGSSTHINTIPE